jgi:DUF971 family protein
MTLQPTDLKLVGPDTLRIAWSDGQVRDYQVRDLRDLCPCATCRERRSAPPPPATALTVLSPAEAQPLRIVSMRPTGHYAYAISFSDGHDTGIFTIESLRELGAESEASP